MERWVDVPGYENCYQVSTQSRARSLDRVVTASNGQVRRMKGKLLCPILVNGEPSIMLCRNGQVDMTPISVLMLMTFEVTAA